MDVATNHSPAKTSGNSRWSFHGSATEEAKRSEAKRNPREAKASATTRRPKNAACLASSAKRGYRFIRQKSFFLFTKDSYGDRF
jgi:hypothetical protein